MVEVNCETVRIAALALADGEKPLLQVSEIEAHRMSCADCRLEIDSLGAIVRLLDSQKRHRTQEDVWPSIERRLNSDIRRRAHFGSRWLLLIGLVLVAYKIILMVPDRDMGIWFRLIPILLVITVFTYLRENPFRINCELKFEGEGHHE